MLFLTLFLFEFCFVLVDSFPIIVIFLLLFFLDQEKGQLSSVDDNLCCIWPTIPWFSWISLSWPVHLQLAEMCQSYLMFRGTGST